MRGRLSTRWGTAPTTHVFCYTQLLDDAGSGLACCTIDSRSTVSLLPPHQRTHRCCSLSRQTFLHIPVSHSVHTARVHSQEHACVDARPLGGVQPPLHTCFAALCRFAGSCNATRCTIDARTRITPSCWRQRPHRPTRPTHPPTYASTCSYSWHPFPPFASPLSSILAMAWLFCLSGASPLPHLASLEFTSGMSSTSRHCAGVRRTGVHL